MAGASTFVRSAMADEIFLRSYHVSRLDMQSDQLNRILAYWGFWMCWSGGTYTFFHWNQRKVWRKFFFSQIHLNSNISSFRSNYQQLFNENFLTWSVDLLPYMVLVFYFFFSLRIEKFNQVNCCLKLTFFLFTLSLAHTNLLCAFSLLIALLVQPNQSDSWN